MATTQPDFKKYTKELYKAFNAHDLEKFLSLHTADISCELVAADGAITHGKEELREFVKGYFDAFPDYKIKLTSCFASGNRQCEECFVSGTHTGIFQGLPATGKSFSFRGTIVRQLRKGKTYRTTMYFDPASLLRQLGVLPSPPQK